MMWATSLLTPLNNRASTRLDWRAARRALASFMPAGPTVVAFLAARMAVAPLGPLGPELRTLKGRVLSLGCGHGVVDRYLAEINPSVFVDGVDLDADRIAVANATESRSPRVHARVGDVTEMRGSADGAYDGALVVDVLHHVPLGAHTRIARALFEQLRDGALCVVKDMATTPRRQYHWNRLHDRLVAGPEPLSCLDPDEMASVFRHVGFDILEVRRLRRLGLYPQYLVLAQRRQSLGEVD